jgi:hypothetical protein
LGYTLVLGILGIQGVLGSLVNIAHKQEKESKQIRTRKASSALSTSYSLSYLLSGGGAIIGVFMIQALKGAFMGYRPFIECPLIG